MEKPMVWMDDFAMNLVWLVGALAGKATSCDDVEGCHVMVMSVVACWTHSSVCDMLLLL